MACAVVTGSRGIAAAVARRLLEDGIVTEIVLLSRNREHIAALPHNNVVHIPFDLSAPHADQFAQTLKQLESWPTPIRTLVNCAGITGHERLLVASQLTEHNLDAVFNANLLGPIHLTRSVLKHMLRNKLDNKSVCNVSSIVAALGNQGQTIYGSTKAGMDGFTKSLSKEVGSRGIRVNCVQPGFVHTGMTAHLNEVEVLKKFGGSSLNRFGEAEEIANVISFLSSPRASFVTGQIWRVDGGM